MLPKLLGIRRWSLTNIPPGWLPESRGTTRHSWDSPMLDSHGHRRQFAFPARTTEVGTNQVWRVAASILAGVLEGQT